MQTIIKSAIFLCSVCFVSCDAGNTPRANAPIVFGDSADIVTEKDSHFLKDNIADFAVKKEDVVPETVAEQTPPPDTVAKEEVNPKAPETAAKKDDGRAEKGLLLTFRDMDVFVQGVFAKSTKINPNAASAAVSLSEGSLSGKVLQIGDIKVERVRQRIQTSVEIAVNGKKLQLAGLPAAWGPWQNMRGSNGKFTITGLRQDQIDYYDRFSADALRSAVYKLARNNRLSKKQTDALLRATRRVRDGRQAPLSPKLEAVSWRITGTTPQGQSVDKEIRIDIP